MSTESLYDQWSAQYDSQENKTRDLEAIAIRKMLAGIPFRRVLEIGAGTGKNTVWLAERAEKLRAVDLSSEMLAKAQQRLVEAGCMEQCEIQFQLADITQPWTFGHRMYDLGSFSLVLEHIEHLEPIFREVSKALVPGGYVYVGEFHPFRQYLGRKARFSTQEGEVELTCFNHHITDFVDSAERHGLRLLKMEEFFDDGDRGGVPRVLGLLFQLS